jgi:hypothetical protein
LSAPSFRRDAVASVLVRDVLAGPRRSAAVVAAGPQAAYLDVGGRLVAVVAASAVRLPFAVVLPAGVQVPTGSDGAALGEGAVWVGGEQAVRVGRWFDPRVRVLSVETVAMATVSTDKTRIG